MEAGVHGKLKVKLFMHEVKFGHVIQNGRWTVAGSGGLC